MSRKKRAPRTPRTDEELREASDWLVYEYWMLKGLARLLVQDHDLIKIGLLRNAVLDSFLVHARALVDFFYQEPRCSTDAIAGDFLEGRAKADWEADHSPNPEWFTYIRTRTNKGVAHIAYDRCKGTWECGPIERGISKTLDDFVKHVPPERLGTRWEKTKSNLRAGWESPMALPPFLVEGGHLETSFYPMPNPNHNWYPGDPEDA